MLVHTQIEFLADGLYTTNMFMVAQESLFKTLNYTGNKD